MPFRHRLRYSGRDDDVERLARKVARLPVGKIDRREKTLCWIAPFTRDIGGE
ncbi:MAG TPA: hypothetical protein VL179_07110 [Mycobacterium sp.]|nr:hypothetical protein [Mycobacterium sp.]